MADLTHRPIVVHIDWDTDQRSNNLLIRERRLMEAALLYADHVEMQALAWSWFLADAPRGPNVATEARPDGWLTQQLGDLLRGKLTGSEAPTQSAVAALRELVIPMQSGAVTVPELPRHDELVEADGTPPTRLKVLGAMSRTFSKRQQDINVVPLYPSPYRGRWHGHEAWEGAIATSLLGELEAFPRHRST